MLIHYFFIACGSCSTIIRKGWADSLQYVLATFYILSAARSMQAGGLYWVYAIDLGQFSEEHKESNTE